MWYVSMARSVPCLLKCIKRTSRCCSGLQVVQEASGGEARRTASLSVKPTRAEATSPRQYLPKTLHPAGRIPSQTTSIASLSPEERQR